MDSNLEDGRVLPDRALVNQAPAGLGPSGFDPSRIGPWACAEIMSTEEASAVNHAMYDRWVAQSKVLPPLERNDCGWSDIAAIAIMCLRYIRDSDGNPKGGDSEAAPSRSDDSAGREASPVSSRLSDTEGR